MNSKNSLVLVMLMLSLGSNAQQVTQKASLITNAAYFKEIPSITEQIANGTFVPAVDKIKEFNPKRSDANKAVPGKGLPFGDDPLWQKEMRNSGIKTKGTILSFEAASAGATPTDPTGAVGPNHFVNSWNSSFRIWDKQGNPLTNAASLGTIFPGETAGDPIVMYDPFADRFLVTEFTFKNGFLVAISQGPDPVNDGWYTYFFSTGVFPDYPKFSIWSDGYYITSNKNSGTAGTSEVVYAIERDKMLVGDENARMIGFPLPGITTSGFFSPLGFNVTAGELPPAGNAPIVYMQDDAWNGVTTDHLKIWNVNVDWDNPSNSSISNPQIIETTPFDGLFDGGSFSNLPQPNNGAHIDALQATIMYMAHYRRFNSHNSVVFNFAVDLDGSDDLAGIRWYELRQTDDGEPWTIFQEGTYAQPDGHSAFCGNMCMDAEGNIAMAYTIVSTSIAPSLRYTGRFADDLPGIMTLRENSIIEGIQNNPSTRYGDYAQMTIDPVDDMTFWSIGEYFADGRRKNQVGVFTLTPNINNDLGIIDIETPVDGLLSDNERIMVLLRNFGMETQVDFPIGYQIDDNEIVREVYTDSLKDNSTVRFIFNTRADLSEQGKTYKISVFTQLTNEEFIENDTMTIFVNSLYAKEIGVTGIIAPVSGSGLTQAEPIIVEIKNYGGESQSGFEISYSVNDASPVIEQVDDQLNSLSSMTYTFVTKADFALPGEYNLIIKSHLTDDANASNDEISSLVSKTFCMPTSDCSSGKAITGFQLGDILHSSACEDNGYIDNTNLVTDLRQESLNELILVTGHGNLFFKLWIDFNDNFVFETDEIIVDNYIIGENENVESLFTDTIMLTIPLEAPRGEHLMRAKTNYLQGVNNDACMTSEFGETEDYLVNIISPVSSDDHFLEKIDFIVSYMSNNQFNFSLNNNKTEETLLFTVHNIWGQKIVQNRVKSINGIYSYNLDMSYAEPGIYLIRLGSTSFGKVKKIVVK